MKYIRQILLIFLFSFLGELLRSLIPLPIPASIYGMILLFLSLSARILRLEDIQEGGSFLVSLFPVLFVAPIVSLMDCWADIRSHLLPIMLILILSSIVCFFVSGRVTQWLVSRRKEDSHE